MQNVIKLFASLINIIFMFLSIKKIEKIKIKFTLKLLCVIWVATILIFIISFFPESAIFVRPMLSLLILSFLYSFLLNKPFFDGIPTSFVLLFFVFISEIIYSLILIESNVSFMSILNSYIGKLISNFSIPFICYLLISVKEITFISRLMIKMLSKNKDKLTILVLSALLLMGILTTKNAYVDLKLGYILNFILIISFLVIFLLFFNEKKNKEKLYCEQEVLFNYITKYEKELIEKNKIIHDFKNQLLTIKGFLLKDDYKIQEYLDNLVDDVKKLKGSNFGELNKIPKGGLKGLFYYKLIDIDNYKINLTLNIEKGLSKIEKIDLATYKSIVKILGVYLDNAIEASANSKEKRMEIEIFKKNKSINFVITNTYVGKIEKLKLGTIGYSSKGKNRGYGLSFVRDILEKNKNFKETKDITGDIYSVTLSIQC